jgi:glycosyltransferase involved in cell wall biosynthesis
VGNAALLPSLGTDLAGFDIVHLHYPFYGGAEPVAHARASGDIGALVLSYHMDADARGVKGAAFDLHRETVQPWIVSHADRLLVSSRDYAESSALVRIDGAIDRAHVLPYGIDLERFRPGESLALRARLGIAPADRVVLFVGGLDAAHRFKGLDVLVAAATTLTSPAWRLIVIGDGNDRSAFERAVAERGMTSRVMFTGHVADDLLPCYYRVADIHVLPSIARAESAGIVTLEASATAVPSIVSNLPGVRTYVVHDTTGILVPAGDTVALASAINRLLKSDTERIAFGRAARRRVEQEHAWEPLMDRLVEVYQSAVDGA